MLSRDCKKMVGWKKVFMKDDWIEGTVGGTRAMMIDNKGNLKCERKR